MRKTKIVCTMGPAVDQDDRIRQLIVIGMNVARLNFSHGTYTVLSFIDKSVGPVYNDDFSVVTGWN